jgi:hypothetical protein
MDFKLKNNNGKVTFLLRTGKQLVRNEMATASAQHIIDNGTQKESDVEGYPINVDDKWYFEGETMGKKSKKGSFGVEAEEKRRGRGMKTFYSEFARHCIRFYVRHPNPQFRNDTEKLNWCAGENAIGEFSEWEQEVLRAIFLEGDTLADNIYQFSESGGISQDRIWRLVNNLERKIANIRGLIENDAK